ncbi:MAG: YHS domain-containing protein [Acidobacteriota bacterium]
MFSEIIYMYSIMSGLIKILFYALIAYFIYMVVKFYQSLKKPKRTSQNTSSKPGIMVKDEVCNTYLPKEDAIKEVYQGKEYYFCSNECRKKFLESKKKARS